MTDTMTASVEKRMSSGLGAPNGFKVAKAFWGALIGFVCTSIVLDLMRSWAGQDDIAARGAAYMLGFHGLDDFFLVSLIGGLLGAIAGGYRPSLVFSEAGFWRACFGAFAGYGAGAALVMGFRDLVLGWAPYANGPVYVIGVVVSLLTYMWGIGAWTYWWSYMIGAPTPAHEDHSGHGAQAGWKSYFTFNTDHKVIGIQYLVTVFIFLMIGGGFAEAFRAELAQPGLQIFADGTQFNRSISLHGIIMLLAFVIPVFAGLANFVLPIMIGASDMAYPKLNALSFWMLVFGGSLFLASIPMGAFEAGWTNYATLSSTFAGAEIPIGQLAFIMGVQIAGSSSIVTALNFIVTIFTMRAPGMTFWRMPLLVWANLTTSFLVVFGTPFIAASQFMVLFDSVLGTQFFNAVSGGDPISYQHIFWFYSHPAVYIMVLPGFGIISEVITTHARKPIFGYKALAISLTAIGFLGFVVWAHHMFTSGMPDWFRLPMMLLTMMIAVPTGIKVLGWSATLWKSRIHMTTAMHFALGFLFMFTIGGITGIMLASVPFDQHVQDSYFVVGHFHYVLFGGSAFAVFAGMYHWFPKMTGRMADEGLGKLHFWLTFIGMNATFFPMHWIGTLGMPRRVADYEFLSGVYPSVSGWNFVVTMGALLQGVAFVVFVYNMVNSWSRGRVAESNPWRSHSLEWKVASPPPLFNFVEIPQVVDDPYVFGQPDKQHAIVSDTDRALAEGGAAAAAVDPHATEHPPEIHWSAKMPIGIMGILFFIGSEIALFMAFFFSYFFIRVDQAAKYSSWAEQIGNYIPLSVATFNSLILFTSSVTIHYALIAVKRGARGWTSAWVAATLVLGLTFLGVQIAEYGSLVNHELIGPSNSAFSTVFFSITGLHGSHVLVGAILLTIILVRSLRGHYGPEHDKHVGFEAMGIYWHFVDVVWIFVFSLIYLPGNLGNWDHMPVMAIGVAVILFLMFALPKIVGKTAPKHAVES